MARFYQGRMLYPNYVGNRRHPRAGRPHPFLYANRGRRTWAHKYMGTQPTGYRKGVAGSGGRPIIHAASMARRIPLGNRYAARKLTKGGHQSLRDMREARIAHRADIRRYRNKINVAKNELAKRDTPRHRNKWNTRIKEYRDAIRTARTSYRQNRRNIATRGPMYAGVQKGWFGGRRAFTGWRPTRRYRNNWGAYAGNRMHFVGRKYA